MKVILKHRVCWITLKIVEWAELFSSVLMDGSVGRRGVGRHFSRGWGRGYVTLLYLRDVGSL